MKQPLSSIFLTTLLTGAAGAEVKLLASDPGLHDHFGRTLSVSGDRAVIGSRFDEHGGVALTGSAYVFLRSGASWVEEAKLTADNSEFQDLFGHSVAIDGDTVLVGARNDDHSGVVDAGSVYVFVRDGSGWSQEAKLTASDAAEGDAFGISVNVSGDTAIVGALYGDHAAGSDSGAAYVFERSGSSWSQTAKLTASDAAALDAFGWSVELSGDSALVAARYDDHAGEADAGSAYVFVRDGSNWTQQAKLTATGVAAGDEFGHFVALSGDTALVGAPARDHLGGVDAGAAFVFVRTGTSWSQDAVLTAGDAAAGDAFGHNVALSGDVAAIGAAQDDHAGGDAAGSAYVFVRDGAGWSEAAQHTASDASDAEVYGSAVDLTDGRVLVGAPHDNLAEAIHAGSVYVYVVGPDCNANDVPDAEDVGAGTSLDLDGEGTPDECQPFSAGDASVSIAAGGTVDFALAAGAEHAGEIYIVLGSVSGTTPGIPVDGFVLPLNPDPYLLSTLGHGGFVQSGIGTLDGVGAAAAAFVLPPGAVSAGFAGLVVHHAYAAVSLASGTVTLTSNAMPTTLAP